MNKRINWTDELIASELMKIANQYDPPRMPSHSEMETFCGDSKLSNAITRRGGSKTWAEKLGLEWGDHETAAGVHGEEYIAKLLKDMGHDVETTPTRFPYDLLVNKCVKIDVKSASTSHVRGYPVHAFRIAKKQPTCDLYILYEADTDSVYVVPAHRLHNQVQIVMGLDSKLYKPYKDAFSQIEYLTEVYRNI